MTHIKLTINGDTLLNGDLGQWTQEPPTITNLKTQAGKEPWAIPTMQAIATAAIHQTNTTITVCTRDSGWSIDVTTS